ncbi:MAG: hypothetical protein IKL68_02175 [Clostridia bacterium]|nr:hypothetical protein [Clostridia bacterium]
MSLTKLNENLNRVQSLPNKPTLEAEELKAIFDESANIIKEYINEVLTPEIDTLVENAIASAKIPIEDNLTSTSVSSALSALQGKVLKDLIDVIQTKVDGIEEGANKTIIEDVLTSTSTTNALSANQGKELKTLIDGKQNTITIGTATPSEGNSGDIYIQYFS